MSNAHSPQTSPQFKIICGMDCKVMQSTVRKHSKDLTNLFTQRPKGRKTRQPSITHGLPFRKSGISLYRKSLISSGYCSHMPVLHAASPWSSISMSKTWYLISAFLLCDVCLIFTASSRFGCIVHTMTVRRSYV